MTTVSSACPPITGHSPLLGPALAAFSRNGMGFKKDQVVISSKEVAQTG